MYKRQLVSGLNNFSSSPKQVEEEFLKWNKKNSLISYQLGFHAEYKMCIRDSIGEESQLKLQDTMQKIVNDSNGGMVCIII